MKNSVVKAAVKKVNDEIVRIFELSSDPQESLYRWIDAVLGIEDDGCGGMSTKIDALPVWVCIEPGKLTAVATAVPFCRPMLTSYRDKGMEMMLYGLAKFDTETGCYLGGYTLPGFAETFPDLVGAVENLSFHAGWSARENLYQRE